MDGGAWRAAVRVVAERQTQLSDFTFMRWKRKWQPTPVLLPEKSQERRSLLGYSPWDHEESDKTEQLHFHFIYPKCMRFPETSLKKGKRNTIKVNP